MTKDELVEKCARIINPWAWGQFDTALAPYKENRGSAGSENFWHQNLWQAGCRSEADVISHWRYVEKDVLEGAIVSWRDSIEKARAALAIAMPAAFEMAAGVVDHHRPDASFDDSGAGAMERNALLDNVSAEIRVEGGKWK